jgi:hypothetical protein
VRGGEGLYVNLTAGGCLVYNPRILFQTIRPIQLPKQQNSESLYFSVNIVALLAVYMDENIQNTIEMDLEIFDEREKEEVNKLIARSNR